MEEQIPLKDAAQQFGVKLDRLRRAAWDGRLEARQLGNQWIVAPSEVAAFSAMVEDSVCRSPVPRRAKEIA